MARVVADTALLTPAGEPPKGYVRCAGYGCLTYIWKPATKRPRCSDCAAIDQLTAPKTTRRGR